jgi:hypothetical protein
MHTPERCNPRSAIAPNWQSEFLAILAMVLLSIFLRERGSPESKKVDAPHGHTGK